MPSADNGNGDGGGILFDSSGVLSVTYSTISGNRGYYGGGINTVSGRLSVIDSTVRGNDTTNFGGGGGIYTSSGVASLTNSTISGNNSYAGGGISAALGSVDLTNSNIYGNSGGGVYFGNSISSYSLIENSVVASNLQDSNSSTPLDLVAQTWLRFDDQP